MNPDKYALALVAIRKVDNQYQIMVLAATVEAYSQYEAEGKAHQLVRQFYPESEGYSNYSVDVCLVSK